MCGIAGSIDPVDRRASEMVRYLNNSQCHRGPDHSVMSRVSGFTLGNTRLAIQDPGPAGNQPFVSDDGRYHCVFNGEIYNHRDLVARYRLPVRSSCDGEVIPQLWAKMGTDALAELRGMFAIALVDSLAERLYLARDPFGIKPLHWRVLPDGRLVFASECKPLARLAGGARVSPSAIARYLHLGAVGVEQSPFVEVAALPPNSVAVFDQECRVSVRPILPDGPLAVLDGIADTGHVLADSIGLHLGAEVPVALLLSSGVDSATIAAVGQRLGRKLTCLTVSTPGSADETYGARRTARRYGHRFQKVAAELEASDVENFFAAMQRPSVDGLNTYLVCKAVHDVGFKVALSGLGLDEAVGGYSHFRLLRYLRVLRVLQAMPIPAADVCTWIATRIGLANPEKVKRLLSKEGPRGELGLSLLQREILPSRVVSALTGVRDHVTRLGQTATAAHWQQTLQALAAAEVATYLQPLLLQDADAFSMSSSVELRVPFVDRYAFPALTLGSAEARTRPAKKMIGTVLSDPYLSALAAKPKLGFSVPMKTWMTGPLSPLLAAASETDAPLWSLLDREAATRAGLVPVRATDRWAEAWSLAAFNAWLESGHAPTPGLSPFSK